MTRNIAGYIAGGYQVAEGSENQALKNASFLALDDVEHLILKSHAGAVVQENQPGSFEKFMGALGAGGRKPGQ